METYFLTWTFTILLLAVVFLYTNKYFVLAFEDDYLSKIYRVGIFALTWIIYVVVVSTSGMIDDFSLPPKLPLFIILPAFIFIGFVLTRPATSTLLVIVPAYYLIGIQAFRVIVELIIWLAYKDGILPVITTFEGYNYDVLVGITSIPIAFYTFKNRMSRGLLIFWNIAGLFILANTVRIFLLTGFFPHLVGLDNISIEFSFLHPPLIFIAGLFMPLAILFHGLSLKQLLTK